MGQLRFLTDIPGTVRQGSEWNERDKPVRAYFVQFILELKRIVISHLYIEGL